MRQQNIKRMIRDEVRRAVRYEVGREMKRFKIILEMKEPVDETAATDPAPPDDSTEIPPDSDVPDDIGIDPGSVAVS
jgi:hypothetical protein